MNDLGGIVPVVAWHSNDQEARRERSLMEA
jgi:hypothetical protein